MDLVRDGDLDAGAIRPFRVSDEVVGLQDRVEAPADMVDRFHAAPAGSPVAHDASDQVF